MKLERRCVKLTHRKLTPGYGSSAPRKPPLVKALSESKVYTPPPVYQPRRYTDSAVSPYVPASKKSGKSYALPSQGKSEGEGSRGCKKWYQKDRKRNRDERKGFLSESGTLPPLILTEDVEEEEEEEEGEEVDDRDGELEQLAQEEETGLVGFTIGSDEEQEDLPPLPQRLNIPPIYLMASQSDSLSSSLTNSFMTKPPPLHSVKIQRSQSDAQFSLPVSSNFAIMCPSDRKKFYRTFMRTLKLYSRKQQHFATTGKPLELPKQQSMDLDLANPNDQVHEAIWQELRAYLERLLMS